MLRCRRCGHLSNPVRMLFVGNARPYLCAGCGAPYLRRGLGLLNFGLTLVVWFLLLQVMYFLHWPVTARLAAVVVVATLVNMLLGRWEPLEDGEDDAAGDPDEPADS